MNTECVKLHLFLDACCEVESISAEMYYYFAALFRSDSKASQLWRKMAMEEENHARQVGLAKKMINSIGWINLESWRSAYLAKKMIQQIAASVQKSPPSSSDALTLSLHCEKRMETLHMQNAILLKGNAGNSMFKAMLSEDKGHIALMESMKDERSQPEPGFHVHGLRIVPSLEVLYAQQ